MKILCDVTNINGNCADIFLPDGMQIGFQWERKRNQDQLRA
jgi:hypothetical protein